MKYACFALFAVCFMGLRAYGAYGLKINPESEDSQQGAFVPVNAEIFRLHQPDGQERVFVRDLEDEHVLHGESPWLAELDERRALVMTEPDFAGGRTGFMFLDGFLRSVLVEDKQYDIDEPDYSGDESDLAALWPARELRLKDAVVPDIWAKSNRLRLWFDNPNLAGIFLAIFSVAVLWLFLLKGRCWKALAVLLSLGLFVAMILTGSRGALLSFLVGLFVVVGLPILRSFTWRKLFIGVAIIPAVVLGVWLSGFGDRYTKSLLDAGPKETSRLVIWQQVPRMIAGTPDGWGIGNAADAYIQWFQESPDCIVRDLVSGHMTLLVEVGWLFGVLYLTLWIFLLLEGLRQVWRGASSVPMGVLTILFCGAWLNPVLSRVELVVLPIVAAVLIIGRSMRSRSRKSVALLAGSIALSVLILGGVIAYGKTHPGQVKIQGASEFVRVGDASSDVWVVEDNYVLHGGYWWLKGNQIRAGYAKNHQLDGAIFCRGVRFLPKSAKRLVLVGESGSEYLASSAQCSAEEVIFIAPPFSWKKIPEELKSRSKIKVYIGELAARHCKDYETPPDWVRKVRGCELYLPQWLDIVSE